MFIRMVVSGDRIISHGGRQVLLLDEYRYAATTAYERFSNLRGNNIATTVVDGLEIRLLDESGMHGVGHS